MNETTIMADILLSEVTIMFRFLKPSILLSKKNVRRITMLVIALTIYSGVKTVYDVIQGCIETEQRIEAMGLTEAFAEEEERTPVVDKADDIMVLDYETRKVFFIRNGMIVHTENMSNRFQDLPDGEYHAKQMSSGIFLMGHNTEDIYILRDTHVYYEGYELSAVVVSNN